MEQRLTRLWRTLTDEPMPQLPPEPLPAFVMLLGHMQRLPQSLGAWLPVRVDEPDLYTIMANTDSPQHQLMAATQVAELLPFATPGLQDCRFYADTIADPSGSHRVYARDQAALPGLRWFRFARLQDAVDWMVAHSAGDSPAPLDLDDDAWELAGESGGAILEGLIEVDLGSLLRDPPSPTGQAPTSDPPAEIPGWQRRHVLAITKAFAECGHLRVPNEQTLRRFSAAQRQWLQALRASARGSARAC